MIKYNKRLYFYGNRMHIVTGKPSNKAIFQVKSDHGFNELSLRIFRYQYLNNSIYKAYIDSLGYRVESVTHYSEIPFLPIEFFKTHTIISSGSKECDILFTSSGSSGNNTSKHYVSDIEVYKKSFMLGFDLFYGSPKQYIIIALLPAYLEREGSSLIYMADQLIRESNHKKSGFYLDHTPEMINVLKSNERRVIILGVTFALLDLAEKVQLEIPNVIIMETGGMKGRRKELVREEVHQKLCSSFLSHSIHSEYGMTELLSQAYSKGNGIFHCPPWMKTLARDTNDPLSLVPHGKTGGLNIIDLANINSCSFIATQDLGKTAADGSFEVMGRFDYSDIRGCNLLLG